MSELRTKGLTFLTLGAHPQRGEGWYSGLKMTFALVLGLAQSWRLGSPGIYPSPSLYTLPSAFRMAVKTILGEGGGRLPVSFKSSCCRGGRGCQLPPVGWVLPEAAVSARTGRRIAFVGSPAPLKSGSF